MAGNNDRIHGYNAIYRNDAQGLNYYSFNWLNNRPTAFINRPVAIIGGGDPALDHQGHIVPQSMLNLVLDPLMQQMAAQCDDMNDVVNFIAANAAQYPWLNDVYQYGLAINAPMFDFDEDDPEDRVGGFFSIVTWNPINICRAPDDNRRNGYPGNNIDAEVVAYINANPPANIIAAWLASLNVINGANPVTAAIINDYIGACSDTLIGQLHNCNGYYSFPWRNANGILVPN